MPEWSDMEEGQYNELLRLATAYHREARRCKEAKAYIAGCAVAGASLEAALIAIVHLYADEVEAAGHVKVKAGKPKNLLKWTLPELLDTAAGMGWLPRGLELGGEWNTRRAKIGDYAEALRQTRNLIHPARYLQDHSPSRVTKKYLDRSIDIFEAASDHLTAKVYESLQRKL